MPCVPHEKQATRRWLGGAADADPRVGQLHRIRWFHVTLRTFYTRVRTRAAVNNTCVFNFFLPLTLLRIYSSLFHVSLSDVTFGTP